MDSRPDVLVEDLRWEPEPLPFGGVMAAIESMSRVVVDGKGAGRPTQAHSEG